MTADAMTADRVMKGHLVEEIAEANGVSVSTVYRSADLPKPDNARIIAALRHGLGHSTSEIQQMVHVRWKGGWKPVSERYIREAVRENQDIPHAPDAHLIVVTDSAADERTDVMFAPRIVPTHALHADGTVHHRLDDDAVYAFEDPFARRAGDLLMIPSLERMLGTFSQELAS